MAEALFYLLLFGKERKYSRKGPWKD